MPIDLATAAYQKTLRENAYIVSDINTVASGETFNIHLKNPEGTDESIVITDITISGNGPYESTIYDGFSTAPSGGTSVTIENLLLDSDGGAPDSGQMEADKNVTFTANASHAVGVVGSGGVNTSSVLGGNISHPMLVVQEDREVVVEVTNTDGGDARYAISMTYFETTFDPTER